MGCFIALIALLSPRLALFLVWLFTDRVSIAFNDITFLVPVLGFFFLPWTTLAWVIAYAPLRGVNGVGWVIVLLAVLVDVSSLGAGARARSSRA
jgi:hypothetical protein